MWGCTKGCWSRSPVVPHRCGFGPPAVARGGPQRRRGSGLGVMEELRPPPLQPPTPHLSLHKAVPRDRGGGGAGQPAGTKTGAAPESPPRVVVWGGADTACRRRDWGWGERGGAEQMAEQTVRAARGARTAAGGAAAPEQPREGRRHPRRPPQPRRTPPRGPLPSSLPPPPSQARGGRSAADPAGPSGGAGPVGGPQREATRPGLTSLQLLQRGRQQPGPVAAAAHDRQQREAARPRGGTGRSRRHRRRHLRRPPQPRRPQATPPQRQRRRAPPTDVTGGQWEGEARGEREEGARREGTA